jgi:asparagine synthase (glutamine-hydrolysing)
VGDFLVDFRHRGKRREQAESLRFYPDMVVDAIVRPGFTLFLTRPGCDRLWAPFESHDGFVTALTGRVALTSEQWDTGSRVDGAGGLACKAIYLAYRQRGLEALKSFSGGFAIHIYDPVENAYFLVSDQAGALPCYTATISDAVLCSHPDVLAELMVSPGAAARSADWDLVSMAQFVSTGVVSFPYSYHRNVVSLDFGCIHRFELADPGTPRRSALRYAPWQAERLCKDREDEIAQRLADAITTSSRHRTLPILGRTAVALSGGLDSRTILCAAERHGNLLSFCAFDEHNSEFRYAKAIADKVGVELIPFKRDFDHYADNAEMGVRISGGMGELASNHFLGFRDRLKELGVDNLVTGCYFDYLFKSLALDSRESGLLRQEQLRPFSFQTYLPHFSVAPAFARGVRLRLEALFPRADRDTSDPVARSRNAMRRTFPLYHEGDNAQRLIPQRVIGWQAPAVDPALLELCRSIPPEMKLNKRVFRNAVQRVCGEQVSGIPDSNTGLPISASPFRVGLSRYRMALRNRIERRRKRLATEASWPNWSYYIRSSKKLQALWRRPNPVARELIGEITGEPFRDDIADYGNRPTQYFMRLLTLKLWLDQRV